MPETALSAVLATSEPATHAISAGVADAADATNGNSFANTGNEVVVVRADANARTVQFRTAAGVAIGSSQALAANQLAVFGPFNPNVYGSSVCFLASNVAVTARAFSLRTLNAISR